MSFHTNIYILRYICVVKRGTRQMEDSRSLNARLHNVTNINTANIAIFLSR